ncbi:hypothetical protein Mapa_002903 [Marchantia paleacea]|nr:hypothetical protein Mapa_002903 [Marchantia paleacea]
MIVHWRILYGTMMNNFPRIIQRRIRGGTLLKGLRMGMYHTNLLISIPHEVHAR